MDRHLFLFGSGPPFTSELAEQFSLLAGGENGTVAVFYEKRKNEENDLSGYTDLLKRHGLNKFLFFPLENSPDQRTIEELKTSTGIIIGGGNTEKYQKALVESEFKEVIQGQYQAGRPVAGFSAGALISPEHCVISPKDNPSGSQLYKEGLGLLQGKVVSVHFDTWEEEFSLKIAMKKTNTKHGYGIDEAAGIYFLNETLEKKDGSGKIHSFKQKDAD